MKNLILLGVICMAFVLTSCLKEGNDKRSGQGQLFYITKMGDTQVAHNGNFAITSKEIKEKEADKWYIMSWIWSSENGMTGTNVLNAVISQIDEVPTGMYLQAKAPQEISAPIVDFGMITGLAITNSFGDYLIFKYEWEKKEGESVQLKLYYDKDSEASSEAANKFKLGVRLEKMGTSTQTSGKTTNGIVAVKMSALRSLIDFGTTEYRDIQLEFNYYKTATEQTTTTPYPIRVFKK